MKVACSIVSQLQNICAQVQQSISKEYSVLVFTKLLPSQIEMMTKFQSIFTYTLPKTTTTQEKLM